MRSFLELAYRAVLFTAGTTAPALKLRRTVVRVNFWDRVYEGTSVRAQRLGALEDQLNDSPIKGPDNVEVTIDIYPTGEPELHRLNLGQGGLVGLAIQLGRSLFHHLFFFRKWTVRAHIDTPKTTVKTTHRGQEKALTAAVQLANDIRENGINVLTQKKT